MSFSISVIENTLRMSKEVFEKLQERADLEGNSIYMDDVLQFDSDAYEHADFLNQPWALKILDDHSVNGDVIWGDEFGETWGYRFKKGKSIPVQVKMSLEEI